MKLTLWFLNRITQWEMDHEGVLGKALAGRRHDVRLGRRVEKPSSNPDPNLVELVANDTQPSFRGELMHEGYQQRISTDKNKYDEYFMPIPLKCLGSPKYDGTKPQLTPFWEQLIPAEKQQEFLQILDPAANYCFSPDVVDTYWKEGKKAITGVSELAQEFSDVRMNTSPETKIGLYQILQQAKEKHGPNVLIGYSQGGTVVNYLAYIDEHFVAPDKRCILGVVSVQGALRGSTLAMHELQEHVLNSLVEAVHALWGERLLELLAVPDTVRARVDPLLQPKHKLEIGEVTSLLDLLYELAKPDNRMREFIRTARKWVSGLSGDRELAFWDLDTTRLNQPGSVMEALQAHPLMDTYCGAVVGANFHIEPLVRAVVQNKFPSLGTLEGLVRGLLRHIVHRSEDILRTQTFDMMPAPLPTPNPPLEQLHQKWQSTQNPSNWMIKNGVSVSVEANDCVIPSVCQLMPPGVGSQKFLGNYVNEDASHISGALLDNTGPTDLDYVQKLLNAMADNLPAGQAASGPN